MILYLAIAVVIVLFIGLPALIVILGGRGVRAYDEER